MFRRQPEFCIHGGPGEVHRAAILRRPLRRVLGGARAVNSLPSEFSATHSLEATGGRDTLVQMHRLDAFLHRVAGLRDHLPVQAIERIGRGQSNLTFRIRLTGLDLVLRRPPPGPLAPSAHDVLREFRVLQGLHRSPVPVPEPVVACNDETVIGAPFYLMELLPGDAIRFDLPESLGQSAERRRVGEQLVDALAALHQLDPKDVRLGDLGRRRGYLPRQLRRWRGQLDVARTRATPDLDWTTEWLERQVPEEIDSTLVHGDYKLDNAIYSYQAPTRLLGIVDWEMATIGDPLADLGWLVAFWARPGDDMVELPIVSRITELPGFAEPSALVERYEDRVARPVKDLRYYVIFSLWKLAVVLEGHWARHVAGRAPEFDFAYLESKGPEFWAHMRRRAEVGAR
jgi:aminoglycoside phosphotransferase (APT) family kinase protein